MLLVFGWAVIQTSRAEYAEVDPSSKRTDDLDETLEKKDSILHKAQIDWFQANMHNMKWQFTEYLNNHRGLLQFHASSNHRGSQMWALADFIRLQSRGSYGLIHVHDDEDYQGRLPSDYAQSFRVWRILDGELTEHDDLAFSPFASKDAFGGHMF